MKNQQRTRIILADDHPVVRAATRAALGRDSSIEVVAEAGTLDEMFTLLQQQACDIVVLCLQLSGQRRTSGIAAVAALRREFPKVTIIAYPDSYSAQTTRIAISLGALGIVAKHEATEHLTRAVHAVRQGLHFVSSGIHRTVAGQLKGRRLSLDEELLLQLLADGNPLEDVAHILQISTADASSREQMAMNKLGIQTRDDLYNFLASWRFDGNPAASEAAGPPQP